MMEIQELDRVLLKDGREGTVMAGAPNGPYAVDVGDSPETWDNITVKPEEIEKVLD